MAAKAMSIDYLLFLDFEATCERDRKVVPQEIIEFPVMKVNPSTWKVEATFHQYVQPRVHPQLTEFCKELTGITQEQVDGQPFIEDVLRSFDEWMREQGLLDPNVTSLFITCGDWDLNRMLPSQAQHFGFNVPAYFKRWCNIKKEFSKLTGKPKLEIKGMQEHFGLEFEGRLHSGIDDVRNLVTVGRAMGRAGHVFNANGYR